MMVIHDELGRPQLTACLELDRLPIRPGTIATSRVKAEIRSLLAFRVGDTPYVIVKSVQGPGPGLLATAAQDQGARLGPRSRHDDGS